MSTDKPAVRTTLPGRLRALSWKAPALWAAAAAVAYLHAQALFLIPYTPDTVSWLLPLALSVPGILTMVLLKNGFRRWYRWAAICLLFTTTYTDSAVAVLAVGEAWGLHRQWVTERDGTLFRFGKRQASPGKAAKPSTGTSGRERNTKTA